MKIIFMRATTENNYLEIYVQLCIELFRKFNDKDNHEMNFKKLLLSKCQKQFNKMIAKEEQDRASRKASMQAEEILKDVMSEKDVTSSEVAKSMQKPDEAKNRKLSGIE
jgi:intergrase/recombinase